MGISINQTDPTAQKLTKAKSLGERLKAGLWERSAGCSGPAARQPAGHSRAFGSLERQIRPERRRVRVCRRPAASPIGAAGKGLEKGHLKKTNQDGMGNCAGFT